MNRYETLRKKVCANPTYDNKKKIVKMIRKEITQQQPKIKMQYIEIGIKSKDIVVVINCDFDTAKIIKGLLNNKILKTFDIKFKVDKSYPQELFPKFEVGQDTNSLLSKINIKQDGDRNF